MFARSILTTAAKILVIRTLSVGQIRKQVECIRLYFAKVWKGYQIICQENVIISKPRQKEK